MSKFSKTRHANLVKSSSTGVYFIRAKVGGRLVRDSLQTDKEGTALIRLADRLKRERENAAIAKESRAGRMLVMDCITEYLFNSAQSHKIKKRTKDYHREAVRMIRDSWPGIDTLDATRVTGEQCKEWAEKLRKRFSPSRFNGTLDALRGIFSVAVKAGARLDNPVAAVERLSVPRTKLSLPSSDQFQAVLAHLDARKSAAKYLVRFLAYTGLRIEEANRLEWRDVDADKGELHVRITKNSEERRVPIIPELVPVLDSLRALILVRKLRSENVLPICTVKNVLKFALRDLKIKHFTHHDCRHLFATRCIESGVDIPTVAKWLGHKDGGALAMKVYGHLRDDHSQAMAAKVKFL